MKEFVHIDSELATKYQMNIMECLNDQDETLKRKVSPIYYMANAVGWILFVYASYVSVVRCVAECAFKWNFDCNETYLHGLLKKCWLSQNFEII